MHDAAGPFMYEALLSHLLPFGQDHLLRYWDQLEPIAQQHLASQVREIDFAMLKRQWQTAQASVGSSGPTNSRTDRATSPPAVRAGSVNNRFSPADARAQGEAALRAGKVAMILVAGGQGTRLGFDHPKGMFPIGPLSRRTLFEVLVDRLRAMATRYQTRIPLLVMTSPATTAETRRYFAQRRYLGLSPDDLRFFEQGTLPAIDAASGKVLLEGPGSIARAPDGHGGMLAALAAHVGFGELKRRGSAVLFYGQIDNPLLAVCDPEFLGYHLLAESEATTQVVRKTDPAERVGVVAAIDGRLEIAEYSDLSPAAAARKRPDGTLELWAGNTAVHAFDVAFLERMSRQKDALPLHLARKKVPYLNPQGQLIEPAEPNAIKFERFIFDLLPQARNALVVEVARETAFAPVKNASGAASDTPETAQAAMLALDRGLVAAAGIELPPGVNVEIHPSFALDAEELRARLGAGAKIEKDTYFV